MPFAKIEWAQQIRSGDNSRDAHFGTRSKRVKAIRANTKMAWFGAGRPKVPRGSTDVIVTCDRVSPRKLDRHDGLPSAFKAIVDELVELLGFVDDSERSGVVFLFTQTKGAPREHVVRIRIDWKDPT